eukprot:11176912-Lingulodinium_polyedra.AAC.1
MLDVPRKVGGRRNLAVRVEDQAPGLAERLVQFAGQRRFLARLARGANAMRAGPAATRPRLAASRVLRAADRSEVSP